MTSERDRDTEPAPPVEREPFGLEARLVEAERREREAHERGRREERRRVVAWLLERAAASTQWDEADLLRAAAYALEPEL